MPLTPDEFVTRFNAIRGEMTVQGRRVCSLVERAVHAFATRDAAEALGVIEGDDEIDDIDVKIEKKAVALLMQSAHDQVPIDEPPIRGVLTLVKVNNELERSADAAVSIAERVRDIPADAQMPATIQVVCNSVAGIIRDAVTCYETSDAALARRVLRSEDAVERFRGSLFRSLEESVAAGSLGVESALVMFEVVGRGIMIADHATNIAEQVIYETTGTIVRHTNAGWEDLPKPGND